MLTSDEIIQIIASRNLSLRPTRDGLWIAETAIGTRLHREAQATPMLAVELAEQTLLSSEQREVTEENKQIVSQLSTGRFYIKPRKVSADVTVFDAFFLNNTLLISDRTTFRGAVSAAIQKIAELQAGI